MVLPHHPTIAGPIYMSKGVVHSAVLLVTLVAVSRTHRHAAAQTVPDRLSASQPGPIDAAAAGPIKPKQSQSKPASRSAASDAAAGATDVALVGDSDPLAGHDWTASVSVPPDTVETRVRGELRRHPDGEVLWWEDRVVAPNPRASSIEFTVSMPARSGPYRWVVRREPSATARQWWNTIRGRDDVILVDRAVWARRDPSDFAAMTSTEYRSLDAYQTIASFPSSLNPWRKLSRRARAVFLDDAPETMQLPHGRVIRLMLDQSVPIEIPSHADAARLEVKIESFSRGDLHVELIGRDDRHAHSLGILKQDQQFDQAERIRTHILSIDPSFDPIVEVINRGEQPLILSSVEVRALMPSGSDVAPNNTVGNDPISRPESAVSQDNDSSAVDAWWGLVAWELPEPSVEATTDVQLDAMSRLARFCRTIRHYYPTREAYARDAPSPTVPAFGRMFVRCGGDPSKSIAWATERIQSELPGIQFLCVDDLDNMDDDGNKTVVECASKSAWRIARSDDPPNYITRTVTETTSQWVRADDPNHRQTVDVIGWDEVPPPIDPVDLGAGRPSVIVRDFNTQVQSIRSDGIYATLDRVANTHWRTVSPERPTDRTATVHVSDDGQSLLLRNQCPWAIDLDVRVRNERSGSGHKRWTIPPNGLAIESIGSSREPVVWSTTVAGGIDAVREVRRRVDAVVEGTASLSLPDTLDDYFATNFEGESPGRQWMTAQYPPDCVQFKSNDADGGFVALTMTEDQASRTWMVSRTFEPDAEGRVAVSIDTRVVNASQDHPQPPTRESSTTETSLGNTPVDHLSPGRSDNIQSKPTASRDDDSAAGLRSNVESNSNADAIGASGGDPQTPAVGPTLRLSIEGSIDGQPVRLTRQLQLDTEPRWRHHATVLEVEHLDASRIEELRLTIDLMTPGTVHIDNIRLHRRFVSTADREALKNQSFLAMQGLKRGELSHVASLLSNPVATGMAATLNYDVVTTPTGRGDPSSRRRTPWQSDRTLLIDPPSLATLPWMGGDRSAAADAPDNKKPASTEKPAGATKPAGASIARFAKQMLTTGTGSSATSGPNTLARSEQDDGSNRAADSTETNRLSAAEAPDQSIANAKTRTNERPADSATESGNPKANRRVENPGGDDAASNPKPETGWKRWLPRTLW